MDTNISLCVNVCVVVWPRNGLGACPGCTPHLPNSSWNMIQLLKEMKRVCKMDEIYIYKKKTDLRWKLCLNEV